MKKKVFFAAVAVAAHLFAQDPDNASAVPIATQWVLDAAGPVQRNAITSVYLMYCPKLQKKGTSFLIQSGVVVTNHHVIEGCAASDLTAFSPTGNRVTFSKLVGDPQRDLAVLVPSVALKGGLQLGSDINPPLGTAVSTWGFPLIYSGPAPLLSVGYVAGYNAAQIGKRTVKHIVVNAAFNPGNSGGPVFVSNDNRVVGVVVWKQRLFSQAVPTVIEGFKKSGGVGLAGLFFRTRPDGTREDVSDREAIGLVLEEFYDMVQVVIGEAISVSELRSFLREHDKELSPPPPQPSSGRWPSRSGPTDPCRFFWGPRGGRTRKVRLLAYKWSPNRPQITLLFS